MVRCPIQEIKNKDLTISECWKEEKIKKEEEK